MQEATIQKSLVTARDKFLAWNRAVTVNTDIKGREDMAVEAVIALSEVVSRGTMTSHGDLLSEEELYAITESMSLLRKCENESVFKRSLDFCIRQLQEVKEEHLEKHQDEDD